MVNGRDPDIHTAFLGVFKTVGNKRFKYLLELCDIGVHDCGDRRVNIDDKLDILGFILLDIGNEVVKNGGEHIVLVVADSLLTVDLGIVEDITDLIGNLAACIPYRNEITLDLAVL